MPRRLGVGWLALAIIAYAFMPGVAAVHVAAAHAEPPGPHRHAVDNAGHDHHEPHGESPGDDGSSCTLCHLIGTLGHPSGPPAPAASFAPDVACSESHGWPAPLDVPAAPRASASPRAPPVA